MSGREIILELARRPDEGHRRPLDRDVPLGQRMQSRRTALETQRGPFLPTTIMEQFDRGMYTLAGGIIATMATDNYLPEILTDRLGIKDSSTKLVLTRLAVVTGALCTAMGSALVSGCPPSLSSGSEASEV